jgi:hypothetical protein
VLREEAEKGDTALNAAERPGRFSGGSKPLDTSEAVRVPCRNGGKVHRRDYGMSIIKPPRPKRQRLFVPAAEQQRRIEADRRKAVKPKKATT